MVKKPRPLGRGSSHNVILKDQKNSPIRLQSDKLLSDEGFNIWSKLLAAGHKIQVYDKSNPGQTYKEITNIDELKTFFGDTQDYQNYQYILSESICPYIETRSSFSLRRIRESSGYPLNDEQNTIEWNQNNE